jgi:hypothetical protein
MTSSVNLASEVRIEQAEVRQLAAFKDAPIYVWYEWGTCHTQFTGARRVYLADAVAWWSHEPNPDRRGNAMRAAQLCCEVYVSFDDHGDPAELKQEGVDLANETLDNLVMLFCMQHDKLFETQRRLSAFPQT